MVQFGDILLIGDLEDHDTSRNHGNREEVMEVKHFLEQHRPDDCGGHNREPRPQRIRHRHPRGVERIAKKEADDRIEENSYSKPRSAVDASLEARHRHRLQHHNEKHIPVDARDLH